MIRKSVFGLLKTVAIAAFMAWICQPLYIDTGHIDYLLLLLLMGIPFGIGKMFLWLIPSGFGIAGTVGLFAFDILIGGLIGIFVLAFTLASYIVQILMGVCRFIIHE